MFYYKNTFVITSEVSYTFVGNPTDIGYLILVSNRCYFSAICMNALNFETYFVFHIHYRNSELFNFFSLSLTLRGDSLFI